MIDDKTMNYPAVASIFVDFYKEGYLTDEEYKAAKEKLVKKCGINPPSIYKCKLNDVKANMHKW